MNRESRPSAVEETKVAPTKIDREKVIQRTKLDFSKEEIHARLLHAFLLLSCPCPCYHML